VVLIRMNLATEKQIAKALAFQLGFRTQPARELRMVRPRSS
jgi:hypothetical protein